MQAGRLMLRLIDRYVGSGESFALETTLSGRSYARMIPNWQAQGYRVRLIFLRLPNADMAIDRVRIRVMQGGHNIPEDVIRRRFDAGIRNFQQVYRDIVDEWALYDTSKASPALIAEGKNNE